MFSSLLFWKSYPRPTRRLYEFSSILLTISLVAFGYFWFRGLDNVLRWDVLSELGETPFALDAVQNLRVPATAYTVTEQLVASPMTINEPAAYIFAGLWLTGLVLALTGISTLNRLGFSVGTGLFMVALVSLNLDALAGRTDRLLTIGVVILYAGAAFFFNAFRQGASLPTRFGVFLALTLLLGALGNWQFSHVALHVASYAQPAALVLAVALIFFVSFEIINGFLYIAVQSGGRRSLLHFVIISGVYLINLLLLHLYNVRTIDWKLLYFSPFLLLMVSVVLGIWGFRQRAVLLESWLDFPTAGSFLYAGLAIAGLATAGYAFATANDPLTEALEDAVIYTHLVMGALYMLYVVVNFGQVLNQGLDAWKVVYKPLHWPLHIYRIAAGIGIFMLLSANSYFPFYQAVAGYYNGLGDLETARSEYRTAEAYYQSARSFEFQNHKTNYALASLALVQGDPTTAGFYFKQALQKQPSDYAYAGLGRSQLQADLFFDALFTLREGTQKFPGSGALPHNLAYLFGKTGAVDSTQFYYQLAASRGPRPELARNNWLAFQTKVPGVNLDSVLVKSEVSDYVGGRANYLAINALAGKPQAEELRKVLRPDSILGAGEFAYLANYTAHRARTGKGSAVALERLLTREANAGFYNDIQYLQAIQDYYTGDKLAAFDRLEARSFNDTSATGLRFSTALRAFLLKEQTQQPSAEQLARLRTAPEYEAALRRYPLDAALLAKATLFFNQQKEGSQRAYNALLTARRFRPDSPEILQLYIRQSLSMNLSDYAYAALVELRQRHPVAYADFLPAYQAQVALIEKQRENF
ncbi:MAG: hypothetical protein LH606_22515 [Cytophagaceae bacterium]|nr:hypothetical protein [Cytophagaceae bacterium]